MSPPLLLDDETNPTMVSSPSTSKLPYPSSSLGYVTTDPTTMPSTPTKMPSSKDPPIDPTILAPSPAALESAGLDTTGNTSTDYSTSDLKLSSRSKIKISKLHYLVWQLTLIVVPILTGLVVVMSTTGNSGLSRTFGSLFWAVSFTYTIATTLCIAWCLTTGKENIFNVLNRVHDWIKSQPTLSFKWFALCGGLCGASQNVIGALVTKKMGSAIYSLSVLFGCVVTSNFIDHYGLAWTTRRRITFMSVLGTLVLTAGCVFYRLGTFIGTTENTAEPVSVGMQVLCICLAIVSGCTSAFQGPLGAQLGRVAGQFRWAASWSFFSGLVVIVILSFAISGLPSWNGMDLPRQWYCIPPGGLVIVSLFVTAWFPRYLPVSSVWCLVVSGQIISSSVLDTAGWLDLEKRALDWWSIGGLLLVFCGIVIIAVMKQKTTAKPKTLSDISFATTITVQEYLQTSNAKPIESPSDKEIL